MNSGGYLTWDDPSGKGVYFDGRLEVYDTPFFTAYVNHFSDFRAGSGKSMRAESRP